MLVSFARCISVSKIWRLLAASRSIDCKPMAVRFRASASDFCAFRVDTILSSFACADWYFVAQQLHSIGELRVQLLLGGGHEAAGLRNRRPLLAKLA